MTDPWRWRPEPWWLAVGGFGGVVWGAAIGGVWMAVASWGQSWEGPTWLVWSFIGAFAGGLYGGATGVGVGTVLALVVGRDRPTASARPIAAVAALVATPALMVCVLEVITGAWVLVVGQVPLLAVAGIAAAATSWWFAPKMADRPRMVSSA